MPRKDVDLYRGIRLFGDPIYSLIKQMLVKYLFFTRIFYNFVIFI